MLRLILGILSVYQCIIPLKKRNGSRVAQTESEIAEFNGQFTYAFTESEHSQIPLLDRSAQLMEEIVVTREGDTTKLLKGLNHSKAFGPDELHRRILKELATELGHVFAHLTKE